MQFHIFDLKLYDIEASGILLNLLAAVFFLGGGLNYVTELVYICI